MSRSYRRMVLLFSILAALAAFDAALAALGFTPFAIGLRWLRVHLVTLGIFTEAVFGVLPALVARSMDRPAPEHSPGRWLLLNAGLITLLVGIPLVRPSMIAVGGTLVLLAAAWLLTELWSLRGPVGGSAASGLRFYLAGLVFLLLGALIGTGLWLGWGAALHIAVPKESHIHANIWGFASLVLAGLLVDLLAPLGTRPAIVTGLGAGLGARPQEPLGREIDLAFWMMLAGATALLLAPWIGGIDKLMLLGILLYALATAILFVRLILPLRSIEGAGPKLLLAAWLWILVPALALPFIVLGGAGMPVARVETVGPSILVYGWLLQALVALLPAAFAWLEGVEGSGDGGARKIGEGSRLGGSPLSWSAIQLTATGLVASVALPAHEGSLQGLAFLLLSVALASFARELSRL